MRYRVVAQGGHVDFQTLQSAQTYATEIGSFVTEVPSPSSTQATEAMIRSRIRAAKQFGEQLIEEYGIRNVMSGKNTEQIRHIINKLAPMQLMLMSGSLYTALAQLDLVVPDTIVTQDDINYFRKRIKEYLGMP